MAETVDNTDVWITQLDGKFWGVAETLDIGKRFINGIYMCEWEDDELGSTARTRAGTFEIFPFTLMTEATLKIDQDGRKKMGISPS